MPISIAENFSPVGNFALDTRSGPWPSTDTALKGIPSSQRTEALLVFILADKDGNPLNQWYQFQGGLADTNFLPAPWESLKEFYANLPTPDVVRDIQDFAIGTTVVIKDGNIPPAGGWIEVVPDQVFDVVAYPALQAALNSDRLPNITSEEGTVFIKAEQVSVSKTDARYPIDYQNNKYDTQIGSVLSEFNKLIASLNADESIRKNILTNIIGPPAVNANSMDAMQNWLWYLKRQLVSYLGNKGINGTEYDSFLSLIEKIGTIEQGIQNARPFAPSVYKIGRGIHSQEDPGAGWLECDGSLVDHPDINGMPMIYPEYLNWYYGITKGQEVDYLTNKILCPSTNTNISTSNTNQFGNTLVYKGDSKTVVSATSISYLFNGSSTDTATITSANYTWGDTDPLYIEVRYCASALTNPIRDTRRRVLRKLSLKFGDRTIATCGYPTDFVLQGYDQDTDSWFDLLNVTGFTHDTPDKIYEYPFANEKECTAFRIKMTNGVTSSGDYSIYGIENIVVYEYLPARLPNTTKPSWRTWIKVASIGNDAGLAPIRVKYFGDTFPTISPNKVLKCNIANPLGVNTGSASQSNVMDIYKIDTSKYTTTARYILGTGYKISTGSGSSGACSFRWLKDGDLYLNSSTGTTNGTQFSSSTEIGGCEIFEYEDGIYGYTGQTIYQFNINATNVTTTTKISINSGDLYTFGRYQHCSRFFIGTDGVLYSYHVFSSGDTTNRVHLYKWNTTTTTWTYEEVPMTSVLDIGNVNFVTAGASSNLYVGPQAEFIPYNGILYLFAFDYSARTLRIFKENAPGNFTLIKTEVVADYILSDARDYYSVKFGNGKDPIIFNDRFYFCCKFNYNTFNPLTVVRANDSSYISNGYAYYDFTENIIKYIPLILIRGYRREMPQNYDSYGKQNLIKCSTTDGYICHNVGFGGYFDPYSETVVWGDRIGGNDSLSTSSLTTSYTDDRSYCSIDGVTFTPQYKILTPLAGTFNDMLSNTGIYITLLSSGNGQSDDIIPADFIEPTYINTTGTEIIATTSGVTPSIINNLYEINKAF